jgi:hypothetical protein
MSEKFTCLRIFALIIILSEADFEYYITYTEWLAVIAVIQYDIILRNKDGQIIFGV